MDTLEGRPGFCLIAMARILRLPAPIETGAVSIPTRQPIRARFNSLDTPYKMEFSRGGAQSSHARRSPTIRHAMKKPSTATKDKRKQGPPPKAKLPGNKVVKKAPKKPKSPAKPRGINARQERFSQFVASGIPAATAYAQAGYKDSEMNGERNSWKLKENEVIKTRIAELLAKNAEKSEYKRGELVKLLVSILQTPVGAVDENHILAQEVTVDSIGEATIRKRVKMMGKIEAARLLVDIMGWKAPEEIIVESGPKTLDAIKERAERVASVLNLRARMKSAVGSNGSNGHSNGNGNGHAKPGTLSRWKSS